MEKEKTYGDLNTIELLSIAQLNTHPELKDFYVASYQRGYRWTKEEVEYLLNDINDFFKSSFDISDKSPDLQALYKFLILSPRFFVFDKILSKPLDSDIELFFI